MSAGLPAGSVLMGLCGATAATGIYLALYAALTARTSATHPARWTRAAGGWVNDHVEQAAGSARARRLLLADDLALAGRDRATHTATRVATATACAVGTAVAVAGAPLTGVPVPALLEPVLVGFAAFVGVAAADRPIRRRAKVRRQETRLAIAAYLDLVRVLLAGGLPLPAALRLAADAGHGWAFSQIATALAAASARHQPADAGLDILAHRVPLAEWRELRLTVTSALRGASPVEAMDSKATHLRAAEAAQARAEASTADAELELPAAAVALAFVGFLTYPLLALLTGPATLP
ncbi:type II secretion system F family protein [Pseudofrankia sp. BMG5.36]|uniref:type II secretion system F family protein n=1 Tax=Pseudofrankia sp. BMG5.36 TaxID=1834512 RepID=UPI0008D8E68F|nr:type II secretion system F family protein [Pseudofrankia sp. BMG5.36]OHV64190.1 hypothetical protein BCD48_37725 [Pseudofrankia sp. BMG5.36]